MFQLQYHLWPTANIHKGHVYFVLLYIQYIVQYSAWNKEDAQQILVKSLCTVNSEWMNSGLPYTTLSLQKHSDTATAGESLRTVTVYI